jgi:hypothetical protein
MPQVPRLSRIQDSSMTRPAHQVADAAQVFDPSFRAAAG